MTMLSVFFFKGNLVLLPISLSSKVFKACTYVLFGVLQSNSPMLQVTWFEQPSSVLLAFPRMQVVLPVFSECQSHPSIKKSHFSHNSAWALSSD